METISQGQNTYSTSASLPDNYLDMPLLPNSIDASIVEHVLSRKCKVHPLESSNLIYLNQNAENVRICYVCAREQGIPHKRLLLIRQLLNISPEGFLPSFPVLTDEQLSSNVKKMIDSMDLIIEQVDEFFNQLKESINASIEKSRQAQRLKLDSLANQYMKVLESFQDISQIDILQEILINSADNESQDITNAMDSETNNLRSFIAEHLQKSEENTKIIKENFEEFLKIKNTFSLDQPKEIQTYINDLIQQQLDMFGNTKEFVPYLPKIELNVEVGSPFSTKSNNNNNGSNSNTNMQIKSMTSLTNKSPKPYARTPKIDNNKSITSTTSSISSVSLQLQPLMPFKKSLLQSMAFIPSKDFKQSQLNSEICRQPNGTIKIRNKDTTNNTIQCFMSQNLVPQEKYVIRLKLQNYNSYPNICVGLLEDENKDKQWVCESEMYYNEVNGGDVLQIIKGGQLHCGEQKKIGEKELEFRVHLAERVLKIGNYPSYENVVQLEKGFKIRPYKQYMFAVSINNFNDSVVVSEFQTVNKFDEQM